MRSVEKTQARYTFNLFTCGRGELLDDIEKQNRVQNHVSDTSSVQVSKNFDCLKRTWHTAANNMSTLATK